MSGSKLGESVETAPEVQLQSAQDWSGFRWA
ncbi:hypothetical protein B0E55_01432 [Rhodococcus sp. 66b]|nr:hypothetical protein B0E55_01432 [Rhodococcus sp. 66b]